jgi:hypothetical protein
LADLCRLEITRSADNTSPPAVYLQSGAHAVHPPGPRLDPVVLDRVVAAVLTVGALLDAWLGGDASGHRLATALAAVPVTASVALRRRYPALVGTAVPVFATLNFAVWHGPHQEALTNTLKHAGDAHATVLVSYRADSLELEIADDGQGGTARVSGGGHGLVGMRERVALCGGRLDAGRTTSGGFVVRVVLPT